MTSPHIETELLEGSLEGAMQEGRQSKVGLKDFSAGDKVLLKRFKLELLRQAHSPANLKKAHDGLQAQLTHMEKTHNSNAVKYRKAVNPYYLGKIPVMRKALSRLFKGMHRNSLGVQRTYNRLFNGLTAQECEERYEALLRIPLENFKSFDRLSEDDQEAKLLELLKEHGEGSRNGGFSPTLLNAPSAYYNSHLLDDRYEADGTRRRPQFLHELIIRIIYACMHPEQYKTLFFHRTDHLVKRWGAKWRQVRSEGRFAMMRVMMVLIPYMDYKKTLRAGIPCADGDYRGISRATLAERAGLSLDSVKGALRNLESLGFIHKTKQPYVEYEKADGTSGFKGLPIVRCISQTLIAHLGLTDRWQQERNVNDVTLIPQKDRDLIRELAFAKASPEQYSAKDIALIEAHIALIDGN